VAAAAAPATTYGARYADDAQQQQPPPPPGARTHTHAYAQHAHVANMGFAPPTQPSSLPPQSMHAHAQYDPRQNAPLPPPTSFAGKMAAMQRHI
jgi:hypothetical protein